jgi:iron complex transport system substrate-binding protein
VLRRPLLVSALSTLLASTVLTACGSSEEPAKTAETTRVVRSSYGEVEIPSEPKRIIADVLTIDYLTALGYDTDNIVGVFGASYHSGDEDYYQHEQVSRVGLIDPGFAFEANVEEVAAAKPDLILLPFDQIDGAEAREELAQIAPLVAVPTSESTPEEGRYGGTASFQDWRGTLRSYGAVLDREDEAEAYIEETEGMIEDLREEHADTIASSRVVQAKSTPDYVAVNPITNDKAALGSILLREMGFREPDAVRKAKADEWGSIELSQENSSLLDGDLLFLEVREGSTRHEESPLWKTLNVVRNDRVITVGNHWQVGGAVGAREVLEDIDETLTEISDES